MTRVYRILRAAYARKPFDGEGAYQFGGRWSSPGTRLSYTSEYQSLAMLEYFVHLDSDDPPNDLVLATAEIPDDVAREHLKAGALPSNWRESPAPLELAAVGDGFVRRAEQCLLIVPSALAASENNWLINPQHKDFKKVLVRAVEPLSYDCRMFPGRKRGSLGRK